MRINDIKALLRAIGITLVAEGALMLLCIIAGVHFGDGAWRQFVASGCFTMAVGGLLWVRYSRHHHIRDQRMGYLLVVVVWVLLALFGTLPFLATGSTLRFVDAFFEAMSGFTSTGATIFANVQQLPASVLLWRSLMQWVGAFGIIIMVLALMPSMGINKYSLYTASASVEDPTSDLLADNSMSVRRMVTVYLLFTALFIWLFLSSGMHLWDSVNMVLANLSSGGFSIYNDGIASLTPHQQCLVALAMLFGGVNFTMIYLIISFRWNKLEGKKEQVISYLLMFAIGMLLATLIFHYRSHLAWGTALHTAFVQAASAISTTGTQAAVATQWWSPVAFVFALMAICGGMAGSTSGGLKTMRVIILFRNVRTILRNRLHPRAVNPVRLNNRPVAHSVINNVMVLFFVYVGVAVISVFALMLCGEGGPESIGATMGCITGYGPRFGFVGADATYGLMSTASKYVCLMVMLLGRLECLTVLVLFMPSFWHRR